MSICYSGVKSKNKPQKVIISITEKHPLIRLAQALPWSELVELILPDLKKTKSGFWWMGRKLKVRVHLGVYLLQQMLNKTDRQMEHEIHDNGAYQLFCGQGIVEKWHIPDHTKIEEFRSRLSKETQKDLANCMAKNAIKLGFANAQDIDIDSTVQEANMTYPADSGLLKKLGLMSNKVGLFFNQYLKDCIKNPININIKKISSKAREYFFLAKDSTTEMKDKKLKALLKVVRLETKRVVEICEILSLKMINKMPWNYKKIIIQIKELASQYFKDVKFFLKTGTMVGTKILSFHLNEVICFTKNKLRKKYQFGRGFQLGRINGNFMFVTECESVRMSDKTSLLSIIEEHQTVFDHIKINSVATDKGYYSKNNEKFLLLKEVNEIGIQRPHNIKSLPLLKKESEEKLINRRSGIEPLIGHLKQNWQMGRSRMKSDKTIEASGYTAVLGFNMRQLIRCYKLQDEGILT